MTVKTLKFIPGSVEWLDTRTRYITATDVASLFALNPHQSAAKVLESKVTPPQKIDNKFLRAGRLLEPGIFIALQEAGLDVEAADHGKVVMIVDDKHRISCSLDGKVTFADTGFKTIVECKATGKTKFESWADAPPINYLLQVQTQLMLTKRDTGILACLCYEFPFSLIVWQINASDVVQKLIKEEVGRFWDCYKTVIQYKYNKNNQTSIKEAIFLDNHKIFVDIL